MTAKGKTVILWGKYAADSLLLITNPCHTWIVSLRKADFCELWITSPWAAKSEDFGPCLWLDTIIIYDSITQFEFLSPFQEKEATRTRKVPVCGPRLCGEQRLMVRHGQWSEHSHSPPENAVTFSSFITRPHIDCFWAEHRVRQPKELEFSYL